MHWTHKITGLTARAPVDSKHGTPQQNEDTGSGMDDHQTQEIKYIVMMFLEETGEEKQSKFGNFSFKIRVRKKGFCFQSEILECAGI